MIGRDDGADFVGFCRGELAPGDDLAWYIELCLQLVLPLRAEQLGRDDENLGNAIAGDEFACDKPRRNRLAKTDIVRKQRHR